MVVTKLNLTKSIQLILLNILLLIPSTFTYFIPQGEHKNITLTNFAFGSCFRGFLMTDREDIFKTIILNKPELWIWLGDTAYLDDPSPHYLKTTLELNLTESKRRFDESKNDKCIYNL